jgi:hypothetical protein
MGPTCVTLLIETCKKYIKYFIFNFSQNNIKETVTKRCQSLPEKKGRTHRPVQKLNLKKLSNFKNMTFDKLNLLLSHVYIGKV